METNVVIPHYYDEHLVVATAVRRCLSNVLPFLLLFWFVRWDEQDLATQQMVRRLALSGQLEFVEGGWCQADELVADLEGRAENLAVGSCILSRLVFNDAARRCTALHDCSSGVRG